MVRNQAVKLRNELKTSHPDGIKLAAKITTVYSYEKPIVKLAELDREQQASPDAYGAMPGMRIRVMPVIGTQPALFGMAAAAVVLATVAGRPFKPRRSEPMSVAYARKLCDRLKQREAKLYGNRPKEAGYTPVADVAELLYTVEELWHSKSAYSNVRKEGGQPFVCVRFDRSKPALPYNLLFVTQDEAAAHEAETAETGTLPWALIQRAEDGEGVARPSHKRMPTPERLEAVRAKLAQEEALWI